MDNQEENLDQATPVIQQEKERKRPSKKPLSRTKKVVYWLLGFFILLLLTIPLLLNLYAERIFGETIRQIVKNETGGKYTFNYSKISFNILLNDLIIHDLAVFQDTSYRNPDTSAFPVQQNFADLSIPELHFSGSGIYNVIREKKLVVNRFYIGRPGLKLYLNQPKADTLKSAEALQIADSNQRILHTYFKDYLSFLKIIDFELSEGALEIIRGSADSAQSIRINDFSVLFSNLQVDSLSTQTIEHLFLTDSLGLSFKSGLFEFFGKRHFITFNNLEVSIKEGTIEVLGLTIKPDTTKAGYDERGWVQLSVPAIKLNGIIFQQFADKNLTVSEIIILEPDILFHPAKNDQQTKFDEEKLARQIFEAATKLFYPIEVGKISIQSASFRIDGFESKNLKEVFLPDISLDLYHLKMDSASYDERSPRFFMDDLRLTMNEQEFFFKKSARLIKFGFLDFDTKTSQLELCDLFVEDLRKNPKSASVNLQVPALHLQAENFVNALFYQKLKILTLDIQQPAITIRVPDSVPPDSKKIDAHNLFPEISGFLKELSVSDLRINGANINFGRFDGIFASQVSTPDISVVVTDFLLNKNAHLKKEKLFYSSAIEINAVNLAMLAPDSVHQLFFDKFSISTKDSSINILGLHADTLETLETRPFFAKSRDRLNMEIDQVELKKIDFAAFFDQQFIEIDTVSIKNPSGYFIDVLADQKAQAAGDKLLQGFRISHFMVENGDFYLREIPANTPKKFAFDGLTFSIDCLQSASPGKRNKIEADNIEFLTKNLVINLSEKGYSAEMSNLKISSADSIIKTSDFIIQPLNSTVGSSNFHVRAKVPVILFKGIAIAELYENNIFDAREIRFDRPSYRLILAGKTRSGKQASFSGNELKDEILKIFKSVSVDRFEMNNADLEVFGGSTFSSRDLLVGDFDFKIDSIFVDSASNMTDENLFFTDDIHFSARKPIKASVGDNLEISFGAFSGSTKNGFLKAENIMVNGKELNNDKVKPKTISEVEIVLKSFDLKEVDFFKLVTQQKLALGRIKIVSPDLWLTREISPAIQTKTGPKEIDFYKVIAKQISELQIAYLEISDASVKIQGNKVSGTETFQLSRINADFRNILVDSSNNVFENKFLYSDLVRVNIRDYSLLSPDSLYLMGAAGIGFSSKNSTLKIDSGFVAPQFDEELFAAKVGHQTDRFKLNFDSAWFENINIPEILYENRVAISNARIFQLMGDDYRDKTYELLPDHYASLPVTALKKLPVTFRLDTLKLENSRIQYREYVPPAFEPGIIWFDGVSVEGRNITNDSVLISQNPEMNFMMKARLMNEAEMAFSVNFNLKDTTDKFYATGTLNELELTSINPFLENVAFVKVKKGTNNLLTFNFEGNDDVARGELFFNYDKLSIRLIDKETMQARGFGESVASFIANNFIVRTDNPKYTVLFRKGQIYFERNKQKSFFSFVAKSLLSGISTTIRGGNEERKEKRKKR